MELTSADIALMNEMAKTDFGRKKLIETATIKHDDNWQDVATPYDICGEMCDLVVGKADKYIVFFSLEFLEVLIFEKGIKAENILFIGDFITECGLAKKLYGVDVKLMTKNDVIKNGKFCNEIFTFLAIDKQKEETNNLENDMKLNKVAVIANFPYQVPDAGDSTGAKPIYHLFIESVIDNIKPDHFVSINPSRWMVEGRGLTEHRERMMNDRRMKKIVHFGGEKEVFNTVSIKGGVNYFHWMKDYDGECEFVNGNTTTKRFLNAYDIIVQDNSAFTILEKVLNGSDKFLDCVVTSRKPFGIPTNFSNWDVNGINCYMVGKKINNINVNDFNDKNNILNKWKVAIAYSGDGASSHPDKNGMYAVIGSPFIIEPNAICTETYIIANSFNNKKEAENFVSYMKSKFFRFMLSMRVSTQHVTSDKYTWTPDQLDYSAPWTDAELYKKYNLTRQEVAYIESKIKAI